MEHTVDKNRLLNKEIDFDKIYKEYATKIYAYVYNMVRKREIAEDIVQDTFVKALKYGMTRIRNKKAFLFRVAHNLAIDYIRKNIHRDDGDMAMENDRKVSTTENILDRVAIQKAIDSLPPKYKDVFVLKEVNGFDYQEISDILRIPIGTVKSRLHRAIERLKVELTPYMEGR